MVDGGSVGEVIDHLEEKCRGIKSRLCDGSGELRRFVNLYLNEKDIRDLAGLKTKVRSGDVLTVIPAIAGGAI